MVVSWLIVVCWLVGCLLLIGMVEVPTDRNFGAIGLGLTLASELAEMNPWAILLCGAEPMPAGSPNAVYRSRIPLGCLLRGEYLSFGLNIFWICIQLI